MPRDRHELVTSIVTTGSAATSSHISASSSYPLKQRPHLPPLVRMRLVLHLSLPTSHRIHIRRARCRSGHLAGHAAPPSRSSPARPGTALAASDQRDAPSSPAPPGSGAAPASALLEAGLHRGAFVAV